MAEATPTPNCSLVIGLFNGTEWGPAVNATAVGLGICEYVAANVAASISSSETDLKTAINSSFLLFSAYLVFLMQAGFAMLCAGSVRAKNTINILMKNLLDACVGAIAWYLIGFGFAFGEDNENPFIGANNFVMHEYEDYKFWLFQWAFAAASATIVSGSVAERTSFISYLGYSFFLTGFVYPVVVHWVWNKQGWLAATNSDPFKGIGALDYAGSGVVHLVGGVAGFWGAFIVGPRIGRFDRKGSAVEMRGHSATLVVLGTFLLWFGWYGFNPGSALTIAGSETVVGRVAVVTTLGGASAGLSTLFLKKLLSGTWDVMAVCNGALGGLVAVTAGCSVMEPWAGIVVGAVAGAVYLVGSELLIALKIDDPVDAAPLHGGCGMWGVIAVGLFARQKNVMDSYALDDPHFGAFYPKGGGTMLGVQILYAVCIVAWVSVTMGVFFAVLKVMGVLRVAPEEEHKGMDLTKHGGTAYETTSDLRAVAPDALKVDRAGYPV